MATRAEKYPDTKYFNYVNVNPHGRKSDDCVIRAVAYALHQSWETTLREMTEIGLKHGYVPNDDYVINKYLETKGWVKERQPRHLNNTKFTVAEFVKEFNKDLYICRMSGHLTVVDHGVNKDIWDCVKYGGCIGCYYRKVA